MNCPVCQVELKMAERQGVEIDYCPQCRGIWLDRGELEKIIERSVGMLSERQTHHEDDDDYDHRGNYPLRGREGFFGEIFDLFG